MANKTILYIGAGVLFLIGLCLLGYGAMSIIGSTSGQGSSSWLTYGLGFATVTSSTAALVADLTKDGRYGSSMGVLRTVMDVGQSIGPVLTGFMVGVAGYGSAFTLLAAILVAAALMLGLLLRDA